MYSGLHTTVDRGVGEYGLVVEQIALSVQTHHFASSAEAGVYAHNSLLSQWSTKQQLSQVLGKDTNSFVVGLLFA